MVFPVVKKSIFFTFSNLAILAKNNFESLNYGMFECHSLRMFFEERGHDISSCTRHVLNLLNANNNLSLGCTLVN